MANAHKTELSRLTQLTGNPQAAIDVINENSALIEDAIDDAISRSGKIPNQMTAAFDMNSNRIINLGEPKEDYDAVRYKDVSDLLDTTKAVQVEMEGLAATTTLKAQEASESAASAAASAVTASDVLTNPGFIAVSTDLLAGEDGSIYKVNANKTNIDTVAGISEDVTATAAVATDIPTVADIASDISANAAIASDISTNAANAAAISTNAEHISDISATAAISSDISTAAGIASDISTNATNATAISTNAAHISDISTTASIASDISTNATNATAISTNATYISDISTVAGIASDVSTNATNAAAISTNATNITDIQNASANAAAAAASAIQASAYAVGDPAEPATGHSAKWYSEHMGLVFKGTYNAATTYDNNDFVSDGDANSPSFYISIVDNNVGNPLTDTTKWSYLWTVSSTTVGDGTITLTQGGVSKGTFTVNQSGDTTIDFEQGTSIELAPNLSIVGSPTFNNGNISDFTNADYMQFPFALDFTNVTTIEMVAEFTTGADVTTQQNIFDSYYGIAYAIMNGKMVLSLSSNGTSWDIGSATGTATITANTTYHAKLSWSGSQYTLGISTDGGQTYTTDITIVSSVKPNITTVYVGGSPDLYGVGTAHPFEGVLNLNGWNIIRNGVLFWVGMDDIGLDTRANVDLSNLSGVGEAKFNGKQDLLVSGTNIKTLNGTSLLGSGDVVVSERGMPIGTIYALSCSPSYVPEGSLPLDGTQYTKAQFTDLWTNYLTGGTPLLNTCSYADYASDISTYGQCGKFAVDTVNETFKVPTIKDGSFIQQALSDSELGKCYKAGAPNITGDFTPTGAIGGIDELVGTTSGAFYKKSLLSKTFQTVTTNGSYITGFDASRSSSIYGNSNTVQPEAVALRYFVVVADGSINQSMMDWAAWASSLSGKLNTDGSNLGTGTGQGTVRAVVETYVNGTSWYRIYSDKRCEQGGYSSNTGSQTIDFLKPFADTNYSVFTQQLRNQSSGDTASVIKTSSSQFTLYSNGWPQMWEAKGYIS